MALALPLISTASQAVVPLLDESCFSIRAQCYKLKANVPASMATPAGVALYLSWKIEVTGADFEELLEQGIDMSFGAFVSRNTVKGKTGWQHLHSDFSCVAWPSQDLAGICGFIMRKSLSMAVLKVTIALCLCCIIFGMCILEQ